MNVRLPIETSREGDAITKVCVEDVYKIINRISSALEIAKENSDKVLDSIHKTYLSGSTYYEGELIVGTGVSKPCQGDKFDEKIGNDIAFMKCKLNANIKKFNFVVRVWNEYVKAMDKIDHEISDIAFNIYRDLEGVRQYNPDYLIELESKLGIPNLNDKK